MKLNMAKLLAVALIISFQVNAARPGSCKCTAPERGETTHRGGNEIVTFRERKTYKSVRGVVRDVNGEPVAGVLVEVFDHPEWIALDYPASRVEQRRIAACKTGTDGSFCFVNIPSGRYELRASKDAAWNPSHVYVVVNRGSRRSTRAGINVRLTVGT
jgi:protocatechuate 3,4-dioxygenase beta subunit